MMPKTDHHDVGRVIGGRYDVLTLIGKGGMSNVWLCEDRSLQKLWAVKEVKPNVIGARGSANRKAILDEANFMKKLDHPAIPRVVDIIEEGSTIYVVMDYVEGVSLEKVLRQQKEPFAQEEVIDWGIQLCDVLAYLHARHPPVVYRDMKPGNVMLRDDGSLKLIDFGIAEELLPGRGDDGRRLGSQGYSAPEQIDRAAHTAHPTDTRADIYALGTTLYSLVTGIVPDVKNGSFDLRPLREVNPALSDGLEQVILRATQRDPDERYQTIEEMRYDLEHYEELTEEHRVVQRHKVDAFRGRLRVAVVAAAVGVACLVASVVVRNGSYDTLVHEASVASTEETDVKPGDLASGVRREAGASEAERLYTQAIDLKPSRIETYEDLINKVYKADKVFTPTEEQRWTQIWQRHGQELAGDASYARLCYDVGILYLCYYDYLGVKDQDASGIPSAATGQGAVRNASRSADWFARARDACHPETGDYRGLEESEYDATLVYEQIGSFYDQLGQVSTEGTDRTETYRTFWENLEKVVTGTDGEPSVVERSEPMVQLRLYLVAFESIDSRDYLKGFRGADVTEDEAREMLDQVKEATDGLADFVSSNEPAARPLYDEIENGYEDALDNIRTTYNNPVATSGADAGDETEARS